MNPVVFFIFLFWEFHLWLHWILCATLAPATPFMCHLLPLIEFVTSFFIIIIVTYIHTYTYTIIKFNYYCLHVHMLRDDHLGLVNLPEELPWKKNWFFFTQKPLIAYRSSSRGKNLSKFYLTFLSCSPLENSHVVKNPWVEDPCLVQKILSWSSHVNPLAN